jgi:hypothetical protein
MMNEYKVIDYTDILKKDKEVEFKYNGFYYEVFESADTGYVVNLYFSNERDEDGYYLDKNIIDGGLCSGNAMDAVRFMLC